MRRSVAVAFMVIALALPASVVSAGAPGVPPGTIVGGVSSEGHPPQAAIDGDEATYWGYDYYEANLSVELPEALPLSRVELLLEQSADDAWCWRQVLAGDDPTGADAERFAEHYGPTSDGQWLVLEWTAVRAYKYWRIDTVCDSIFVAYNEIRVAPWSYPFTGFYAPVDNGMRNSVRAGSAIPVKFSLGGDLGLDIFAPGYPLYTAMICNAEPIDAIETVVAASASGLQYDPVTDQYTYVWKTPKRSSGCWQLQLMLTDGSLHTADFFFR